VSGMQPALNSLLAPVGIQYRFDAALPLDLTFRWVTCSKILYQPSTAFLNSMDELQISVGASLDITYLASPAIIGTAAYSDEGNRSNEQTAYLGDYTYHSGEQLGDIILAASAYYGNGKVFVLGDTSSFQNTALPSSYQFLHRLFSWLTSNQQGTIYYVQITISLAFLIIALILYLCLRTPSFPFAIIPFLLLILLLLSTTIQSLLVPIPVVSERVVCLDVSHGERISLEMFTEDSLTGLTLNLNRNNYFPIFTRDFLKELVRQSSLVVFNAPTTTFTSDEVEFLDEYMTDGGVIILATGYDDASASQPLLNLVDLSTDPTPLGPIPYGEGNISMYQDEPRFVDSWPIIPGDIPMVSYYNFTWNDYTYHLVVFVQHGKGGLLLISDSQFLLDNNLESMYDYWPGNIIFIKQLLAEITMQEDVS